ncbi:MAG: BON domain-containing protein [Halioglobus sp.]|nr:BON domain-containing protein [Halioglobus sp.]
MNRTTRVKGALTTLAMTALLSAPTFADQSAEQASTSDAEATMNSLERKASDAWREGKLDTIYLFNRHLNNFTIDPEVVGSTVILTGKVESDVDKALAEQLALGIDGVSEVENRLTVVTADEARSGKPEGERALSDKIEDATLTAEVKTQLLANDETHGLSINVDTVSRNVTLSGSVASAAEKDLAGALAEQVEGVSSVNNALTVSES